MDATLRLPDGRTLAYTISGDAGGFPLLFFHGAYGSRRERHPDDGIASASRVRLVTLDRPGYGASTFAPRRRLLDWPGDVALLAETLGLARFAVAGWSGGSAYALACAHALPERVTQALVSGTVVPFDEPGATEGWPLATRVLFALARRAPPLARAWLARSYRRRTRDLDGFGREVEASMAPCDVALAREPAVQRMLAESRADAFRQGVDGVVQGHVINARAWGFDPSGIRVPVHVWHGSDDRNTPIAFARRLARRVPGARLRELPGEGHLLLLAHWREMLDALAAGECGARPSADPVAG